MAKVSLPCFSSFHLPPIMLSESKFNSKLIIETNSLFSLFGYLFQMAKKPDRRSVEEIEFVIHYLDRFDYWAKIR